MQKVEQQVHTRDYIKMKNMASAEDDSSHKFDFTVNKPSRAKQLEAQKSKVQEASWFLSIVKLLVTGIIAIALLLSVVATKLTVVAIGQQFNVSCTELECILQKENETPYIMMVLIMMVPQFISFIKAVGNSAFSTEPWPSKQALFWVNLNFSFVTSFVNTFDLFVL